MPSQRRSSVRRPSRGNTSAPSGLSPELSASAVRYLGALSGVDGCSLFLSSRARRLVLAYAHGSAAPSVAPAPPRRRRRPSGPTLRKLGRRSLMSVPLRAGGKAVGILCVVGHAGAAFPPSVISLCESMASGLVAALEGANITELLLRAKVALEKTFDAMPDLVAILDRQGRITRLNQAMADRAGRAPRELIGQQFGLLFPFCREWLSRIAARPASARGDWTELTDPARGVCYEVKLLDLDVPLPVIGDQAVFMRDVTQEREMARRVIAFERRAAAGDLLTGVAHEVRNPLAAIQAAAEALQRRPAPAEETALLGVIRRQVDRLGALMRDLLHVGRPAPALALEEVDLRVICAGVARTWPAGGERRPVRLSAPPGRPLRVRAEEARLEQVLLNLLDNAAHHSPAGSPIRLELSRQGASVRLRVSDHGTGIAPEILPRLFEPFFTTRPEGTGLGLALVKSIVESYGGAVMVSNNDPPPGCTFEVRLPPAPGAA